MYPDLIRDEKYEKIEGIGESATVFKLMSDLKSKTGLTVAPQIDEESPLKRIEFSM